MAAPADVAGESPRFTAVRVVGVLVLLGAIPIALFLRMGPKLIWSVIVAAVPLGFVLAGYHSWRRACPLAFFATLGQRFQKQRPKKVGEWLGRSYFLVQLGLLMAALAWRNLAANGTPWALAGLFVAVILAAAVVGFLYTGKTWCNYLCPVGLVEKVYLDPAGLRPADRNSQCTTCTACKKHCPDIDQEQGYWKELDLPARRLAFFAWPGVVLGFYLTFRLVSGSWEPYFSGAWTRDPLQASRMLAPGLAALPALPRLAVVPLVLLVMGALSWALYTAGETYFRNRATSEEAKALVRHRALALAGFTAFLTFYAYAGQPALRDLPSVLRALIATAITVTATLVLRARWGRSEPRFVQEKFARGLLKKWEGDLPASGRLSDLYLLHQERMQAKEQRLRAYKAALRDLLDQGAVEVSNLALLRTVRAELGVTEKEHDKLLAELGVEERRLFDPDFQGSEERRLQLAQYAREIGALMMAKAPEAALEALRETRAVDPADHAAVLARLRDQDGPLRQSLKVQVQGLLGLHRLARAAEGLRTKDARPSAALARRAAFFLHLLRLKQLESLSQIAHLLDLLKGPLDGAELARLLDAPVEEATQQGLAWLRARSETEGPGTLLEPLAAPDVDLPPAPLLLKATEAGSPHLRATALALLAFLPGEEADRALRGALTDGDPLVRETAQRMMGADASLSDSLKDTQESEDQWMLRAALRALPAPASLNTAGQETLREPRGAGLASLEILMMLHGVPLFSQLPPEALEELRRRGRERRFPLDGHLCRQGDASDEAFILLRGHARSWTSDGTGQVQILGDAAPGDCLGEMAALDPAPRAATVTALDDVLALEIPGPAFRDLLHARDEVAYGMLQVLTRRLRSLLLPAR